MKKLSLLLATLFAANTAFAQPIWSNKSQGGDDYFVGTIHIGDQRMNGLSDELKAAIDSVDVVYTEINDTLMSEQEMQQLVMQYALLPQGKTLKTELSPEVYAKLEQALAGFGMNAQMLGQFKPSYIALTIAMLAPMQQGFTPEFGIDKQITDYAVSKGKKIVGLETAEQQLQMLDKVLSADNTLTADDLILSQLDMLADAEVMFNKMVSSWLNSDMKGMDELYEMSFNDKNYGKAAEKVLITERNQDWQKQLSSVLEKEKVLVAVGTLHFSGQHSLLKLLGKHIQPVTAP